MPFSEFPVPNAVAIESECPIAINRWPRFQCLRIVPTNIPPITRRSGGCDYIEWLWDDEVFIEESVHPDSLAPIDEATIGEFLHLHEPVTHRLPKQGVVSASFCIVSRIVGEVDLSIENLLL